MAIVPWAEVVVYLLAVLTDDFEGSAFALLEGGSLSKAGWVHPKEGDPFVHRCVADSCAIWCHERLQRISSRGKGRCHLEKGSREESDHLEIRG